MTGYKNTGYEVVIGLEVHVELNTASKIFCNCSTAFGAEPNTHVCPVCSGMPGVLPVMNKNVLEKAVAAGLATNCTITQQCKFDRKNYFYPDLPKAYQTSQLYLPICRSGYVEIEGDEGPKKVRIHQIHMEEDAGKLNHDAKSGSTLIDYNRCGVPLLEIVSEPDMSSAGEVQAYLEKLKSTMEYLNVSDCKMQEGSMRADVNLSVRRVGDTELGTRTETKNMNSFKAIARAIEYEIFRQIEVIEDGGRVQQETRRWDDEKGIGYAMRSKENAHDYRYFPEPDLAPINISDAYLAEIAATIPELPDQKKERYMQEFKLSAYDAAQLTRSRRLAEIFEQTVALCGQPKEAANFLIGDCLRLLNAEGREAQSLDFSPENLAALLKLVASGTINKTTAKAVFEKIYAENIDPTAYVKANGLEMMSDDGELDKLIAEIVAANPKSVADYKGGKKAAVGFLVGQVMKATKGKAYAGKVNAKLQEILNK
ncbi:MAG TPA: Asp-tRNA(Asn)/Glu-tRNA(Gln) amidotransferase subunit GatB [Candidatus Avidehalobacter gallistercoris]|uniref:Aspartyl/glutamyl-tRNA(Asn/Gln) amidotransferase subunit B n=1 Tax=Candidatus Avidehalobacter gallistercoris TaxID=2840694 RepID=A0A9D1HL64_9FIRM|nr:Asp-tRNA(Asn)/Glu-tRNA(Gln) amidotransferase subunit GatB [Candidatus Avidehalobacter gallistercoris]